MYWPWVPSTSWELYYRTNTVTYYNLWCWGPLTTTGCGGRNNLPCGALEESLPLERHYR